jgi:hypothetical protein
MLSLRMNVGSFGPAMQSWAATLHSRAFLPALLTAEYVATMYIVKDVLISRCSVCALPSGRSVLVTKEGAPARLKIVTSLQSTAP